jgi:hypothetical protein
LVEPHLDESGCSNIQLSPPHPTQSRTLFPEFL